jgi:hypothetical protein
VVEDSRTRLEDVRMAAQELKVRRETLLEQFQATQFELQTVYQEMVADADVGVWEQALSELVQKVERLGQVNLAAIDEFKEQSERKEYLDRQFKDLTDALEILESAIRKIDKETRARFQDTFDRVNAGLKERFPRLFGGGHAYLELAGDDILNAGVSIMARPPGKRNSTINQLSGGEKALTAVALVFSIFELTPARCRAVCSSSSSRTTRRPWSWPHSSSASPCTSRVFRGWWQLTWKKRCAWRRCRRAKAAASNARLPHNRLECRAAEKVTARHARATLDIDRFRYRSAGCDLSVGPARQGTRACRGYAGT